jgi:hypothetical protein
MDVVIVHRTPQETTRWEIQRAAEAYRKAALEEYLSMTPAQRQAAMREVMRIRRESGYTPIGIDGSYNVAAWPCHASLREAVENAILVARSIGPYWYIDGTRDKGTLRVWEGQGQNTRILGWIVAGEVRWHRERAGHYTVRPPQGLGGDPETTRYRRPMWEAEQDQQMRGATR